MNSLCAIPTLSSLKIFVRSSRRSARTSSLIQSLWVDRCCAFIATCDFAAGMRFSEKDVCGPDFLNRVTKATKAAAPFLEFLTRAVGLPWARGDRAGRREVLLVE